MKVQLAALALCLALASVQEALAKSWYKEIRNNILEYEKQLSFGGNLTLTELEEAANAVLMEAKKGELDAAFENPGLFAPARNFLLAKDDIEKSEVFKIIRHLPKGSVLHAHDTAIVSLEWMYQNITFRDDLYVCDLGNDLKLKFFRRPDATCNWELLSAVREDPIRADDINQRIINQLTMAVKNPREVYTDVDKCWKKFNKIFAFINPIVTYKPVYEDHYWRGMEEFYEDNIMYMELRSTLPQLYDLDGRIYYPNETVGIYERLTERFKAEHPDFIGAKVIYAPVRSVNEEAAHEYVETMMMLKKLYPNFVAGFDLVGQEDKGNTLEYFVNVLLAVDPSIDFFFHAAETNWLGMSTDENLVDALLLNTKRIGHGYGLSDHPLLLQVVKQLGIAVEVSPISNQVLGLVGDLRNHAARRLFTEEYPVVISNDDPGLWGARALSYDFYEAFMGLMSGHSDIRALKLLAQNSLNYSTLSGTHKEHALRVWQLKWDDFVQKLANGTF